MTTVTRIEMWATNKSLKAKLEKANDKIDGLESDLISALEVLIRRINGEASLDSAAEWIWLNYPRLREKLKNKPEGMCTS